MKGRKHERRALSNVGGRAELSGDHELARLLSGALAVRSDDPAARVHVHAFHSYTARMHPLTAQRLVVGLSRAGESVLDPFCGSGTVLVEAKIAGRRGFGVDANPLAVELARLKTRRWNPAALRGLVAEAERIAGEADARRKAKAGATRNYGERDRELFDAHVLFELDGLRAAIEKLRGSEVRDALWLVLSSILVKGSRQPGDSAERLVPRRLASGYTIRLFAKRATELADQLGEFARLVPSSAPLCKVALGDARKLDGITSHTVDLVVTSPPYPGVYDYLEQHALRLRWLGLDARGFSGSEIGSRRELERLGAKEPARWKKDSGAALAAIGRVLRPGGTAVLLMADSVIGTAPIAADAITAELAPAAGLVPRAAASQRRPHFHGATQEAFRAHPRREHALLLGRA